MRTALIGMVFLMIVCCGSIARSAEAGPQLSDTDIAALRVCEATVRLFQKFPDSIWSGFNLAKTPFVYYMPDKWALLVNYRQPIDSFTTYPKAWPRIADHLLFCNGRYKDLAGQLEPNLAIETLNVAAVPYTDKSDVQMLAFLVHELFHNFQASSFGDIGWEREERYPIEDYENTALAYLEIQSLIDALRSYELSEKDKCIAAMKLFAAIRRERWRRTPAVARYELYQELQEGTAKYVETRAVALMKRVKFKSVLEQRKRPLLPLFDTITASAYLREDFRGRVTGDCISPEDMARNRIYPVGAAQGILLDYLGIEWKALAQQAGPEFNFIHQFLDRFPISESQADSLIRMAKDRYRFDLVAACADSLIVVYRDGFTKSRDAFEAQSGTRFELVVSTLPGVSRSRSSTAKHWLVQSGKLELRDHYDIYTLKKKDLTLEIHDKGVLEGNDWDSKLKSVAWFGEDFSLFADGNKLNSTADTVLAFKMIRIEGQSFLLEAAHAGRLTTSARNIRFEFGP